MSIFTYDGSAWNEINGFYRRAGNQWQDAELSRFNGTDWDLIWPCHFTYSARYALEGFLAFMNEGEFHFPVNYPSVGSSSGSSSGSAYDTLLFFPLDRMRADLSGAVINSASLTLTRRSSGGETLAYFTVGCSLSGLTLSSSNPSWHRNYTELLSENAIMYNGQTQTLALNPSGISAMVNGTADCLCLPAQKGRWSNTSYYAAFTTEMYLDVVYTV